MPTFKTSCFENVLPTGSSVVAIRTGCNAEVTPEGFRGDTSRHFSGARINAAQLACDRQAREALTKTLRCLSAFATRLLFHLHYGGHGCPPPIGVRYSRLFLKRVIEVHHHVGKVREFAPMVIGVWSGNSAWRRRP